jgi:hypothetical protein
MNLYIHKTNRTMTGHQHFAYRATLTQGDTQPRLRKFITMRNSCWGWWGPSSELEYTWSMPIMPKWCWRTDCFLYFKSQEELTWFKLKYS